MGVFSVVIFLSLTLNFCHGQGLQCRREHEIANCNGCPPERTCANRGISYNCLQQPNCSQRCVCGQGYIRNAFSGCGSDDVCDSCGPNEFFDCGPECDNVCATLQEQNRTNCPIDNIVCTEKCYCKDGHARNAMGNCVLISQC